PSLVSKGPACCTSRNNVLQRMAQATASCSTISHGIIGWRRSGEMRWFMRRPRSKRLYLQRRFLACSADGGQEAYQQAGEQCQQQQQGEQRGIEPCEWRIGLALLSHQPQPTKRERQRHQSA